MNKTLPNIGGDTVQPLANPGTGPRKEIPLVQRGRTPAGNPIPVQPQPTPNHVTLNVGLVPQYVLVTRPGSVSGTCPCCVLCPEPQQHAPSPCYSSPPVGPCVCTHYLLGHITTRPGTLTSPGPQASPCCFSVGAGRSLALGSPDSGFPGHCGAPPSRCLHPGQCTISSLPCLSPPLPARTQQGELFQAPLSGRRPTAPWGGQGPSVRPPRSQACRGTTAQPGPQRTGAPKAPPARHGVPILSAVGRALCFVEHLLALFFFFPFLMFKLSKKYVC